MVPWPVSLVVISACGPASEQGPVEQANVAPIPAIEVSREAKAGLPVELDGSGSSDPNGDAITFEWSFDHVPVGSRLGAYSIADNGTRSAESSFVPDVLGTYVVALVTRDDRGEVSTPAYEAIQVLEDGAPPVANAGPDQSGLVGAEFVLGVAGSAVDELGRPLTFRWDLREAPEGSTAALVNTDGIAPSFVADLPGHYEVTLVVENGATVSAPDVASVLVSDPVNASPVAIIDEDGITVEDCSDVALHGNGSYDPDGDALSYLWAVQSRPDASSADVLRQERTATPTFRPDAAGAYALSLSVFDGSEWSITQAEVLAIERPTNAAPVVDAGADIELAAGKVECVDDPFSGSWDCDECPSVSTVIGTDAAIDDADDDAVALTWSVASGEVDITSDPRAATIDVTLDGFDPDGPTCKTVDYELALEGTDCPGATARDSVVVTLVCCGFVK
jgi:hypothetical protein